MSFDFELDTSATIMVIVKKDSAIKGTGDEAYDEYLETLDESLLTFVEGKEPTRFELLKTLEYRDTKKVMNSQMSFEDNKPQVNISFMLEEVRCALVNIHGSSVKWIQDTDKKCSRSIINALYNRGVLMDLYNARRNASGEADSNPEASKKS